MKSRRLLLAALIVASAGMSWKFVAVTTVEHAQQAQNPAPPQASDSSTPVFKAETRLVLVLRPLDYVTKLVSGLLTCKLPLDVNPVAIHATVPAPSLLAQASDVSDSAFS